MGPAPSIELRPAEVGDIAAVAALHAESWRAHYRGSFSDAYLDGPIHAERLAVWTERLSHPRAGQVALLATKAQEVVGFVCVFLDHDPRDGSLIDNLHVAVPFKGSGIGRLLMRGAGDAMLRAQSHRPAYLTVLLGNHAAQRFYERIGGTLAGEARTIEPDGTSAQVLRYTWPSPAALIAGATRTASRDHGI